MNVNQAHVHRAVIGLIHMRLILCSTLAQDWKS